MGYARQAGAMWLASDLLAAWEDVLNAIQHEGYGIGAPPIIGRVCRPFGAGYDGVEWEVRTRKLDKLYGNSTFCNRAKEMLLGLPGFGDRYNHALALMQAAQQAQPQPHPPAAVPQPPQPQQQQQQQLLQERGGGERDNSKDPGRNTAVTIPAAAPHAAAAAATTAASGTTAAGGGTMIADGASGVDTDTGRGGRGAGAPASIAAAAPHAAAAASPAAHAYIDLTHDDIDASGPRLVAQDADDDVEIPREEEKDGEQSKDAEVVPRAPKRVKQEGGPPFGHCVAARVQPPAPAMVAAPPAPAAAAIVPPPLLSHAAVGGGAGGGVDGGGVDEDVVIRVMHAVLQKRDSSQKVKIKATFMKKPATVQEYVNNLRCMYPSHSPDQLADEMLSLVDVVPL